MPEIQVGELDILGYRDSLVPNRFYRQEHDAAELAIVFPGWEYTADMPVLWYPRRLMLARGADVLAVNYQYSGQAGFAGASDEEQTAWLTADVVAATRAGLQQREYRRVTLIGKSLGTYALGIVVAAGLLPAASAVWLTPLIKNDRLRAQIHEWGGPSLFVIGTEDPHYDPALLDELHQATGGEVITIEGGNHILEIGSDLPASIRAMEGVLVTLERFLDRSPMPDGNHVAGR